MATFGHELTGSTDGGRFINFKLAPGEVLLECPYEKSHRITKDRFGRHLSKCRENYKKSRPKLTMKVCRWNALHHYPEPEMKYHEENCMDAGTVVDHINMLAETPKINVVRNDVVPDDLEKSSEDWEEEAQKNRSQNPRGYNPRLKLINTVGLIQSLPGISTKSEREKFRQQQSDRFIEKGADFHDPDVGPRAPEGRDFGFSIGSTSMMGQRRDDTDDSSIASSMSSSAHSPGVSRRHSGATGLNVPGSSRRHY